MDPATLVAQALATGASAGLTGAASSAVSDAYRALRQALLARLSGSPRALERIQVLERRPGTPTGELVREFVVTDAVDAHVEELARHLLALIGGADTRPARHGIDLSSARGVQIGDGNTQHNTFG
ncbi:hypothetical protein [Streptomyces sp. NPDC005209]|uniref:hypothetical protein n=1 Tax=Streptomyces sp. NPDC005209 TaxID=3156715 RepID=UPI0033B83B5F